MKDDGTSPGPAYTAPVRVKAILDELDRAANEYVENHKRIQEAQVHFKAARERFASVKRIAADMLSFGDWFDWQDRHGNVRYAAMTLGDAIREALRDRAFAAASDATHSETPVSPVVAMAAFAPTMTADEIVVALETGGFEFKGAPRRQIHAALLQLDFVTKNEDRGEYAIEDAEEILQMFLSEHEAAKADEQPVIVPETGAPSISVNVSPGDAEGR